MCDVHVEHRSIDAHHRLDETARFAHTRQRMNSRRKDVAARQQRIAKSAACLAKTRTEEEIHSGELLQLERLIVKSRLPCLAMHLLQTDDVGTLLTDGFRNLADVIAVVDLIVAGDVVRHHDQRPRLRRISDALRKADDLTVLIASEKAEVRIDRLRFTFADAHCVDGEHAVGKPQQQNEAENDDGTSERRHAVLDGSESYAASL